MNLVFDVVTRALLVFAGMAFGSAIMVAGAVFLVICAMCSGDSWGGVLPPANVGKRIGFGIWLAGIALILFCGSQL